MALRCMQPVAVVAGERVERRGPVKEGADADLIRLQAPTVFVVVVVVQELDKGEDKAPGSRRLLARDGRAGRQLLVEGGQHARDGSHVRAQRIVRAVPACTWGSRRR